MSLAGRHFWCDSIEGVLPDVDTPRGVSGVSPTAWAGGPVQENAKRGGDRVPVAAPWAEGISRQ